MARGPTTLSWSGVDGDQSAREVLQVIARAGEGGRLPEWLHAAGGGGHRRAGQTATAIQPLEEGTHHILDTSSEGSQGAQATFEVTGGGGDVEPPDAPATVTASEYTFKTSGLKAGSNRVRFENAGQEPHHIIMAPIKRGKKIDDVRAFARTDKGEPPVEEEKFMGTAVLDGGASQVVDLELEKGKYAALCFITDRKGGPPHAVKGMVTEVDVQ